MEYSDHPPCSPPDQEIANRLGRPALRKSVGNDREASVLNRNQPIRHRLVTK